MISKRPKFFKYFVFNLPMMVLIILGLPLNFLMAQGWEKVFGGNNDDEGRALIETRDRGFLVAGFSNSSMEDPTDRDFDIFILRTDVEGELLWSKYYDEGYEERAYDMVEAQDGGFIIVGDFIDVIGGDKDLYIMKIDKDGKFLWSKTYGRSGDDSGNEIVVDNDGNYVIAGNSFKDETNQDQDFYILKIDQEGNEIWSKTLGTERDDSALAITTINDGYAVIGKTRNDIGVDNNILFYRLSDEGAVKWFKEIKTNQNEEGKDIISTKDGQLIISGFIGDNADVYLAKYSDEGVKIWDNSYDIAGFAEEGESLMELENGNIVIAGFAEVAADNVDFLIMAVDREGAVLWKNTTGQAQKIDFASDLVVTADGGFAFTGWVSNDISGVDNDLSLIKTDGNGQTFTSFISGSIFVDGCNDFQPTGDLPLKDWIIKAENEHHTFYGSTDENGFYSIKVDTGNYKIDAFPINSYWKPCVPGGYFVNVENFYSTIDRPIPVTAEINCPFMEVNVSTPFLAECSEVVYNVQYCNLGTSVGEDAYIEVELDDKLSFESSSMPFASQTASKYIFELGDVAVSQCGSFTINTSLACEGIASGQAALVSATIFPDTICTEPDPNWDQSSIIVSGVCLEDSIQFIIANVGDGDMISPRASVVVIQDVIFLKDNFQLKSGNSKSINVPKGQGSTYRIIAEQSEGHPGRSYPTIAVEGCPGDTVDNLETGYVTIFSEDDRNPYKSIDVQEINNNPSKEAVALRGYPKGYGDERFISTDTDLKYTISFSNPGLDTVNQIVIRDTLPEGLDIASVVPGPSSHPYEFKIYDGGILKFTFNQISLAPLDSSTELLPTSKGYITYTVKQIPGNTPGTTISNSAAVYFTDLDYIETNREVYTVGGELTDFVVDGTITSVPPDLGFSSDFKVKIQPNPFVTKTTFTIQSSKPYKVVDFILYDVTGRVMRIEKFSGTEYEFSREHLVAGMYFYSMLIEGNRISSGKILIE